MTALDNSTDAPGITIVSELLSKAVLLNASDIHLESFNKSLRVRFRIDGLLYNELEISEEHMLQVLSRIKVLAHMDIAERRIPQDGKFCCTIDSKSIDLRVSTFPSLYGEKIVVRILDRSQNMLDLEQLGFDSYMLDQVKKLTKRSSGFFLVTGPTGSGKTTTLYSLISYLRSNEKNITTLEDPIEYNVEGITQGQVNPEIGFTFDKGIRSLLRQDPDIIMVGEIRDRETAQVAIQAALTGHLVLSTLHTNDAPSTLMRLLDMGIEPFLLNAALTGTLAQRLARKLCEYCKTKTKITGLDKKFIDSYKLPITQAYTSTGCSKCRNLGYKGRTGIFELLVISNKLRALLTKSPVFEDIYNQSLSDEMKPLIYDAALKVNSGIISIPELIRVLL